MNSKAIACVLAAGLSAGLARAQGEWAFTATQFSAPAQVFVFDLPDPLTTSSQYGTIATMHAAGMDFDTRDSFYYYVASDQFTNPGDRGLWYFDHGVSTQLLNTPIDSTSTLGDLTLSADGQTVYVVFDDGDAEAGMSLYAFGNLAGTPTFGEVGETGLERIAGLAAHPVTGVVYAYDFTSDAFYTLDVQTGAASLLVDASRLNDISPEGAMDFNADGSTLLMILADEYYTINLSTGRATPLGHDYSGVRTLSYRGPEQADCLADTNGDGVLSPADFTAWVAAFNTGADACDQNDDGTCTPADFTAWVANYNAGC